MQIKLKELEDHLNERRRTYLERLAVAERASSELDEKSLDRVLLLEREILKITGRIEEIDHMLRFLAGR